MLRKTTAALWHYVCAINICNKLAYYRVCPFFIVFICIIKDKKLDRDASSYVWHFLECGL